MTKILTQTMVLFNGSFDTKQHTRPTVLRGLRNLRAGIVVVLLFIDSRRPKKKPNVLLFLSLAFSSGNRILISPDTLSISIPYAPREVKKAGDILARVTVSLLAHHVLPM
ncbi:hypothetical protein NCS57_00751200 [Fusarium keratoplasticum]|uniref:Uncharacterized protein n=1 Tax=Fusarium keratoplasticum TaxID=1328300 RepID=A0ACC0QYN0_9HYPO|nr:hypothetical protein NCS57_00751200 [Fusarium keratoplasticum]KAI8669363.1 hypothetical protein NCS57_00751200 [Fusarium keratoplasticum]